MLVLQPVQREVPRRRDRDLVSGRRARLQQLDAVLVDQSQVLGDRHAGRGAPGTGLLDREREVAERLRDLVGLGDGQRRVPALQQFDAFRTGEQIHLDLPGDSRPVRVAGRDDDVPGAGGEERQHGLGTVRVVEDQDPVGVRRPRPQRLQHGGHRGLGRRGRQAQSSCQLDEARRDLRRVLRGDPPDDLVLAGVLVDVLDHGLRLPHAAHAVQRLRQDSGRASFEQTLTQRLQQFQAAGEVGVAQRNLAPHPRLPGRHQGGRGGVVGCLAGGPRRLPAPQRRQDRFQVDPRTRQPAGSPRVRAGQRAENRFLHAEIGQVDVGQLGVGCRLRLGERGVEVPQHRVRVPGVLAQHHRDPDGVRPLRRAEQFVPHAVVEVVGDLGDVVRRFRGRDLVQEPSEQHLGESGQGGSRQQLALHEHHQRQRQRCRGEQPGELEGLHRRVGAEAQDTFASGEGVRRPVRRRGHVFSRRGEQARRRLDPPAVVGGEKFRPARHPVRGQSQHRDGNRVLQLLHADLRAGKDCLDPEVPVGRTGSSRGHPDAPGHERAPVPQPVFQHLHDRHRHRAAPASEQPRRGTVAPAGTDRVGEHQHHSSARGLDEVRPVPGPASDLQQQVVRRGIGTVELVVAHVAEGALSPQQRQELPRRLPPDVHRGSRVGHQRDVEPAPGRGLPLGQPQSVLRGANRRALLVQDGAPRRGRRAHERAQGPRDSASLGQRGESRPGEGKSLGAIGDRAEPETARWTRLPFLLVRLFLGR